jgi:preprotein translocase subunit SecF
VSDEDRSNGDGSSLDDVPEDEVEELEEDVDTDDLDEEELVSLDDAARALLARQPRGHGPLARLYRGETRFDFVGKRRIWFSISTAIILLGIISIVLRGGLNLGIDFKGGTEWTIAAPGVTQTQATNALSGTGLVDPQVELLGTGSKQTLNVQSDLNKLSQDQQAAINKSVEKALLAVTAAHGPKTPPTTTTTAKATTTTTAKAGAAAASASTTTTTSPTSTVPTTPQDKISVTNVGPTWGSSITNKAIEALIIFFIVVAIYISIRFEPKMALAAFIAMLHDVLVPSGSIRSSTSR